MNARRQYQILSDRYFDCMLGDFSSLVWMIGQAPLIAGLVIMRWSGWQATDTLYFVLALSVHWFGLINSCREIAKERPIFRRERLFDISVGAYLGSKARILALLGLAETAIFFIIVESELVLDLNPVMAFGALYLMYLSGMGLGLFLSSVARSPAKAVISVPLAILPQIIFSKFIMPEGTMSDAAEWVARLTPVKWGFEALMDVESGSVAFGDYLGHCLILLAVTVILLGATWLYLRIVKD